MKVIKLDRNDLLEMVKSTVNSLLNESVSETMSSIAADKESVIDEIVNYVKSEWDRIRREGEEPADKDSFTLKNDSGLCGERWTYIILIPDNITEKLGLAEDFELNIQVNNYAMGKEAMEYIGHNERATEGRSYGGTDYSKFKKSTMKVTRGRIDLFVPAINGELQVKGLYTTLYHELNHNFSNIAVKTKNMDGKTDNEIGKINLITQSRRAKKNPHFQVMAELQADPIGQFLQGMRYGKYMLGFKALNFLLYALWERTERNARAESIYGDLSHMKTTRATFKNDYLNTDLCYEINEFKDLLEKVKQVPVGQPVWEYAAEAINMVPKGDKKSMGDDFHQAVKDRFVSRTEELIDILFRKGMKVAELYLQRHEPQKGPSKLQQYKQEKKK